MMTKELANKLLDNFFLKLVVDDNKNFDKEDDKKPVHDNILTEIFNDL